MQKVNVDFFYLSICYIGEQAWITDLQNCADASEDDIGKSKLTEQDIEIDPFSESPQYTKL